MGQWTVPAEPCSIDLINLANIFTIGKYTWVRKKLKLSAQTDEVFWRLVEIFTIDTFDYWLSFSLVLKMYDGHPTGPEPIFKSLKDYIFVDNFFRTRSKLWNCHTILTRISESLLPRMFDLFESDKSPCRKTSEYKISTWTLTSLASYSSFPPPPPALILRGSKDHG
jgi:hypothetical protein